MALKDWKLAVRGKKLTVRGKNIIKYTKTDIIGGIMDEILIGKIDKMIHPKEKNNWLVSSLKVTKLFKTKSQALKFAKQYMRKH